MNRAVEILKILRNGMEKMISDKTNTKVNYARVFNFDERRVSLRMEVAEGEANYVPMGKIDVTEFSSDNEKSSCDCILTALQTGQSDRIVLRLRNSEERERECEKVLSFFGRILGVSADSVLPHSQTKKQFEDTADSAKDVGGFPMDPTRGAQSKD